MAAFHAFGMHDPKVTQDLFLQSGKIIRMGVPPMRIEVLTDIDGVAFEDCFAERETPTIDGETVNLISLRHLRANKAAAGRHKDVACIQRLKDEGEQHWTWCFRARSFILFLIAGSRSSEVLQEVLGTAFDGVINCDYHSSYRKFMKESSAMMQFCLAHLIRDLKFLAEQNDKITRNWAQRMRQGFEELFGLIHRREELTQRYFQDKLEKLRDKLIRQFKSAPRTEQAIRYIVIDRKVTQGRRGNSQWPSACLRR